MKYKVLLIEKDSASMRILKRVIGKSKLDVVSATSLTQARAIFSSTPPESYLCAVVDYELPDAKNGQAIDFALDAYVPSIVITDSTESDVREHILSKEIIDYIPKNNAQIYEYLSRLLTRLQDNKNIGVLVVDKSRRSRAGMISLLKRHNFETHELSKPELVIDYLHEHPSIKLMIIDDELKTGKEPISGVDVVAQCRNFFDNDTLSIIGSSHHHSPTLLAGFLKSGADDYLIKPYCHEEFFVRVMQNIDYIEQIALIRKTANADYLTGLPNRRHFFSQIQEHMKRGLKDKTLALMDLDNFKLVNDNYGHDHGDVVLKEFSKILTKHFGDYCISRFGGEEFCVFLPNVSLTDSLPLLEAFRQAVSEKKYTRKGLSLQCTVSIGVTNRYKRKVESMLGYADENLYKAKTNGRNQLVSD